MSSDFQRMPTQEETDSLDEGGIIREQDRLLPIANVSRIMKMAVPSNAKIAKDAKETVQECVSEFIAFVTSEASDRCLQEKRKTINGEDILWAMESLGFDNYVQLLKIYLQKYKETMKLDKEPTPPLGVFSTGSQIMSSMMVQHPQLSSSANNIGDQSSASNLIFD
jgi:histone H3/H4